MAEATGSVVKREKPKFVPIANRKANSQDGGTSLSDAIIKTELVLGSGTNNGRSGQGAKYNNNNIRNNSSNGDQTRRFHNQNQNQSKSRWVAPMGAVFFSSNNSSNAPRPRFNGTAGLKPNNDWSGGGKNNGNMESLVKDDKSAAFSSVANGLSSGNGVISSSSTASNFSKFNFNNNKNGYNTDSDESDVNDIVDGEIHRHPVRVGDDMDEDGNGGAEVWPPVTLLQDSMHPLMLPLGPATSSLRKKIADMPILSDIANSDEENNCRFLLQLPSDLSLKPKNHMNGTEEQDPIDVDSISTEVKARTNGATGVACKSGRIGKLQVMKSGRVFLVAENINKNNDGSDGDCDDDVKKDNNSNNNSRNRFEVWSGMDVSFAQFVASINVSEENNRANERISGTANVGDLVKSEVSSDSTTTKHVAGGKVKKSERMVGDLYLMANITRKLIVTPDYLIGTTQPSPQQEQSQPSKHLAAAMEANEGMEDLTAKFFGGADMNFMQSADMRFNEQQQQQYLASQQSAGTLSSTSSKSKVKKPTVTIDAPKPKVAAPVKKAKSTISSSTTQVPTTTTTTTTTATATATETNSGKKSVKFNDNKDSPQL